jgi:hypothetical protein
MPVAFDCELGDFLHLQQIPTASWKQSWAATGNGGLNLVSLLELEGEAQWQAKCRSDAKNLIA